MNAYAKWKSSGFKSVLWNGALQVAAGSFAFPGSPAPEGWSYLDPDTLFAQKGKKLLQTAHIPGAPWVSTGHVTRTGCIGANLCKAWDLAMGSQPRY